MEDIDRRYRFNNENIYAITKTKFVEEFYNKQQTLWVSHTIRRENSDLTKMLTFHNTKNSKLGAPIPSIINRAIKYSQVDQLQFKGTPKWEHKLYLYVVF